MLECFHSQIHYTCWIGYFFRRLHENILACDVYLGCYVTHQYCRLSFLSTVYVAIEQTPQLARCLATKMTSHATESYPSGIMNLRPTVFYHAYLIIYDQPSYFTYYLAIEMSQLALYIHTYIHTYVHLICSNKSTEHVTWEMRWAGQQGTSHLQLPYYSIDTTNEHSISITFKKRSKIDNVSATPKSCKCRIINRWW